MSTNNGRAMADLIANVEDAVSKFQSHFKQLVLDELHKVGLDRGVVIGVTVFGNGVPGLATGFHLEAKTPFGMFRCKVEHTRGVYEPGVHGWRAFETVVGTRRTLHVESEQLDDLFLALAFECGAATYDTQPERLAQRLRTDHPVEIGGWHSFYGLDGPAAGKKGLVHSDDPASLPGDDFRVFLPHRSGVDGDDFEALVAAEAGDDAAHVVRSIAEPHVFYVCGNGLRAASSRHSRIGDLVDKHVASKAST